MMKARVLLVALLLVTANHLHAQKIKLIVDQDARGPATTDMQSILIFLQSDKFDVLGITTVSGDQWVKEETQRTLRLLEIAGRTDVPVIQGAEFPLLNSKEESERWEALYGKFRYKGCWSDFPIGRQPRRLHSGLGITSRMSSRRWSRVRRTRSRSTKPLLTSLSAWCISIQVK